MAKDTTPLRGGTADPMRTLALLWGARDRRPARNARHDLSVDRIVRVAIGVADSEGVDRLSMRRIAEELGVGTMTLYTYVPGKAELLELMVDTVHGEVLGGPVDAEGEAGEGDWRARLDRVARDNWGLFRRHPWMLHVGVNRPALGPNAIAKYERELHAVADIGLTAVEMDTVVNLVIGHAQTTARRADETERVERDTGMTDEEWWRAHGPVLGSLMDSSAFPLAAAVGDEVGAAFGRAYDAAHNFEFGLRRILDGIAVMVEARTGTD
ncbi:TetR/AcrR family transcriptional regulator [Streptomyces calidiresistens]|uniref:TetR family transcriptional regulator n=1 Tax=Streptomyces calidiresistens TaxID=1485586 RepID=A0A7W3XX02_9ACTN|nr:TetR/AcrR family transcriptional regulator [Streptomyces calidiresistens]MBB0230286.1 TetR family transcriptional regulator [Streptomyces calidiresistens]